MQSPVTAYTEKNRPQLHFSVAEKWMNDPNGLFYFEGNYHLFYQYHPHSTKWGPMHWGHAISEDLIHWQHLPIALFPDNLGYIFSGSIVVDKNNDSQLGTADQPPILAFFTHHNIEIEKTQENNFQYQSLAYSLDKGISWTKYQGNPIIPNVNKCKDFRDPKVIWHKDTESWIMVLAAFDKVYFYKSENLIDWQFLSTFGNPADSRVWECPDLFPLLEDETGESKWILLVSIQKNAPNGGSATSYFVGHFDGKEFKADITKQKWLDRGPDNYAFVTWSNLDEFRNKVIGIGWMSNWIYAQEVPTHPWRGAMTMPRKLSLAKINREYIVKSTPILEFEKLRGKRKIFENIEIGNLYTFKWDFDSSLEILMAFDFVKTDASEIIFKLYNTLDEFISIVIDLNAQQLNVDRSQSSKNVFNSEFYKVHSAPVKLYALNTLHLIIDCSSIEVFINHGELVFTEIFFPTNDYNQIEIITNHGICFFKSLMMFPLNGIW